MHWSSAFIFPSSVLNQFTQGQALLVLRSVMRYFNLGKNLNHWEYSQLMSRSLHCYSVMKSKGTWLWGGEPWAWGTLMQLNLGLSPPFDSSSSPQAHALFFTLVLSPSTHELKAKFFSLEGNLWNPVSGDPRKVLVEREYRLSYVLLARKCPLGSRGGWGAKAARETSGREKRLWLTEVLSPSARWIYRPDVIYLRF